VIAAIGPVTVFPAKAATTTIPIVFIINEDPVRLGLVASLARPGGNLTGINVFSAELAAKRLDLLRELLPGAARVGVLVNPTNTTTTESTLRDVETAARNIGLQIQVLNASTSREIEAAFASFMRERPDATLPLLPPKPASARRPVTGSRMIRACHPRRRRRVADDGPTRLPVFGIARSSRS
jgi:putative tryptophan/tyrosine transport system substrate-binding protein